MIQPRQQEVVERLRQQAPPVVARILDDRLVLDLRTVAESEEDELLEALARALEV